ncbi:MAG: hypothetical protein BWZ06_00616 [Bacteroidetes bacterium ADurb.BinA261]|jgi:hypothetical protein|nr:MAG: hypothetical protein BWZ06_00616 [Bacteroidetes bacterium ADurb.BinA261]
MKDIIIPVQRQKKELRILLICFACSFLLNIAAIIIYKTSWAEIITQIGYVIIIALALYVLIAIIRLIVYLISRFFKKRK